MKEPKGLAIGNCANVCLKGKNKNTNKTPATYAELHLHPAAIQNYSSSPGVFQEERCPQKEDPIVHVVQGPVTVSSTTRETHPAIALAFTGSPTVSLPLEKSKDTDNKSSSSGMMATEFDNKTNKNSIILYMI